MSQKRNIRLSYIPQGPNSGNCGPCSIKMIADYYGIKKNSGESYTVPSLNRICQVNKEWGTEIKNFNATLSRLGLKRQRVSTKKIPQYIDRKIPLVCLFIDEDGGGHYAVIKGYQKKEKRTELIFHDSYWGRNYRRSQHHFKKQTARFQDWIWAVELPS